MPKAKDATGLQVLCDFKFQVEVIQFFSKWIDWHWLKLIENWFNAWVFYIFLLGAPQHWIYDPLGACCRMHCWGSKLACLRCEKVWAFKQKVQCCLFSGPWVCADKWGAGKDSSFTWLHSNGIAGAGWAWDSNLGVSRNQFTFLHVSPRSHHSHYHIILRWANKIRCWLPIAANTKISRCQESLVESGSREETGDDLLFVGRQGGAASVEAW